VTDAAPSEEICFYLVDVFTDKPLSGNPLAVVADARRLSDLAMRRIAREFNQSETTFLLPPSRSGATFQLRSFTPAGVEVFGAGHNALGAWWWLADAGKVSLNGQRSSFVQEIGGNLLPVEVVSERGKVSLVVMTQSAPSFGAKIDDLAALAEALSLAEADFAVERLPAQVVWTGAPHLLVPVRSRARLDRAWPHAERLASMLRSVAAQGCYLFSLELLGAEATAHARFFNPMVGIWEDPATGSAAGPLACHLITHGLAQAGATLVIEQGYAMARPSRIEVRVHGDRVEVAGRAVVVAQGSLRIGLLQA